MTRVVTIVVEATHNENSDTHLAGGLAKFTTDLGKMGYTVQDVMCLDKEYEMLEEESKSAARMRPVPPGTFEEADEAFRKEEDAEGAEDVAAEPTVKPKAKPRSKAKSKALIDPADFTVAQLRDPKTLAGYIKRQLNSLHKREMSGKARDGAVAAIKDAIDRL